MSMIIQKRIKNKPKRNNIFKCSINKEITYLILEYISDDKPKYKPYLPSHIYNECISLTSYSRSKELTFKILEELINSRYVSPDHKITLKGMWKIFNKDHILTKF